MALLIESSLLFFIYVTSATIALVVTAPPESMQDRHPVKEFYFVQKPSCSPACPPGWEMYGRRCLKYVDQALAWVSAEAHCLKLGANLVSIHNENEYQLVKALIRVHDPKENPTWIGLSNCQEQNVWIWSDGSNLSYTKWNQNEPNFSKGECCVHLNWGDEKNLNDIPCSLKYPFVCVKKLP